MNTNDGPYIFDIIRWHSQYNKLIISLFSTLFQYFFRHFFNTFSTTVSMANTSTTYSFGAVNSSNLHKVVKYNDKLYRYLATGTIGDYYVCKEIFQIIRVLYKDNFVHVVTSLQVSTQEKTWNASAIQVNDPVKLIDLDVLVEVQNDISVCGFGVAMEKKSHKVIDYEGMSYKYLATGVAGDYYVCKEMFRIVRVVERESHDICCVIGFYQVCNQEFEWDPKSILVGRT